MRRIEQLKEAMEVGGVEGNKNENRVKGRKFRGIEQGGKWKWMGE